MILNNDQLKEKISFIQKYINSDNAANGSKFDANANVSCKNIATLSAEIHKDINIQIKRAIVSAKIEEMFGPELALEYNRQINEHEIYINDESNILLPYTYSARESVLVKYKNKKLLISFEQLYDILDLEEEELDAERGVWAKYPTDLYISDRNGWTKVSRVVKKIRHRDIVRVKTAFGEDIYVTDNHPMIIEDNKDATIEAINSTNSKQLKIKNTVKFDGKTVINVLESIEGVEDYGNYVLNISGPNKAIDSCRKYIELSEKFGYVVGFFIAEGNYSGTSDRTICMSQKDENVLKKVAEYLYESTGIGGKIYKEHLPPSHFGRSRKFVLDVSNRILFKVFYEFFAISALAENKNIPVNIFQTNKEFAKGLLAGLIDGDGTIGKDRGVSIRLSSRYCISQLSTLLTSLGFSVGNSYQCQPFSNNTSYKSNYPVFGVSFNFKENSPDLELSFKCKDIQKKDKYLKYQEEGWSLITSVEKLENSSFLEQNYYIYDITTESNTFVLNNLWVHNCVSISMYPLLVEGLKGLGGESKAPQHLSSFCGSFVNLMFAISSQFAGAVAAVELLLFFDYFARKDYGENYIETNKKEISNHLQHIVYALNQPAAARSFQSVFWNTTIFDEYYFNSMFQGFAFPDGSAPCYDSLNKLQKYFMNWFNKERGKALLTFPVITAAILTESKKPKDEKFNEFISSELASGNSFFLYLSDSADSLSSCCRLRSNLLDMNGFQTSLGAGGVATGSINVITINMNRLVQKNLSLSEQITKIHKYQAATRKIIESLIKDNMLPVYQSGFINIKKQYSTIGINGIVEAAEYLGLTPSNNNEYINWLSDNLKIIYDLNRSASKEYGFMFNTEFVPAENLGVKFAKWDKEDGLVVWRDCYNSYFYPVENEDISILDKFALHGDKVTKYLDGGSALHLNLESYPTKEQYKKLIEIASQQGCNYFCTNVKITVCNSCGHINKNTTHKCSKCGSSDIEYATRIIGYLKKIGSWSHMRKLEEKKRHYH